MRVGAGRGGWGFRPDGRSAATGLEGDWRGRREGPRSGRPAEQRDELAAVHSNTSSARASTDEGISMPSAFGGLEVDHQIERGRRLHRQVGRLLALENAIDVTGGAPELVGQINPIGDQATVGDENARIVDGG